jgi:hypothetical protein
VKTGECRHTVFIIHRADCPIGKNIEKCLYGCVARSRREASRPSSSFSDFAFVSTGHLREFDPMPLLFIS